jgi:nucleotide-binding universal stress UspA family protein
MTASTKIRDDSVAVPATIRPVIKTILLATDGSPKAEKAFENATRLARHNEARLIITYYAEPNDRALFGNLPCESNEQWRCQGQRILAGLAQRAREEGITEVETIVENHQNEEGLNDLAQQFNVDLIMLASHFFTLS